MDLTPYSESEMLQYQRPIRVFRAHTAKGTEFFAWYCLCGRLCNIAVQARASGGICNCGREWNLDTVDMSAIMLEAAEPRRYDFAIIVDRNSAFWRVWNKKPVGFR